MSINGKKRRRKDRLAGVTPADRLSSRVTRTLTRGDALGRMACCAAAAVVLVVVTHAWYPPFPYRTGFVPTRDIVAKHALTDVNATTEARRKARQQVRYVYRNDPTELESLQHALGNKVREVVQIKEFDTAAEANWSEFLPAPAADSPEMPKEEKEELFRRFQQAFVGENGTATPDVSQFEQSVQEVMAVYTAHGLLEKLEQEPLEGNQAEIWVTSARTTVRDLVRVREVRISDNLDILRQQLQNKFAAKAVADATYHWMAKRLPTTLSLDHEATQKEKDRAAAEVEVQRFPKGHVIVEAEESITPDQLSLLSEGYQISLASMTLGEMVLRVTSILGMYTALFALCGLFVFHREPNLLRDFRMFCITLSVAVAAVILCFLLAHDRWRAELIPILLVSITMAMTYRQETAILLSAAVTLAALVSTGQGLYQFVNLMAGAVTAILFLGRIRLRNRLVYVGCGAGLVVALTFLGTSVLASQPIGLTLLSEAALLMLWAFVAGSLMTVLLPAVESVFGILTDIRLYELGDASHPLLQELVRRAPGTYNHSVNVASLAEAAADQIGARGLLARVGAYFHDVGKMLKPGYFVENQGQEANRHETLMPAMSTLIIIAHVKDGVDLGRQYHLPQPIIDFIQQHHGTTLVEYFYNIANQQSRENPDVGDVSENSFRYPGPKPQTKETAVMMLADAVESASRALNDPTPARIEALVENIAMKRLLDGQFDECELTLRELRTVTNSLVKSLTAVFHARVKYPERPQQRTA